MNIFIPIFQCTKTIDCNADSLRIDVMDDSREIDNVFTTFEKAEAHILSQGYIRSNYFKDGFKEGDYHNREEESLFPYATAYIKLSVLVEDETE